MTSLHYAYEPYVKSALDGTDESEIPCYRIYEYGTDDRIIAETNEDLPAEVQEHFARMFTASPGMLRFIERFTGIEESGSEAELRADALNLIMQATGETE